VSSTPTIYESVKSPTPRAATHTCFALLRSPQRAPPPQHSHGDAEGCAVHDAVCTRLHSFARSSPLFVCVFCRGVFVRCGPEGGVSSAPDSKIPAPPHRRLRQRLTAPLRFVSALSNGLDKVVEDAKYRMRRYGVSPNLLVQINPFPEAVSTNTSVVCSDVFACFLAATDHPAAALAVHGAGAGREDLVRSAANQPSANPNRIVPCHSPPVHTAVHRYKEGGPAAITNFEAGAEGFTTRAFRGCGVVTSDPFEVSDGASEADRSP
jgi:hypothetical protein